MRALVLALAVVVVFSQVLGQTRFQGGTWSGADPGGGVVTVALSQDPQGNDGAAQAGAADALPGWNIAYSLPASWQVGRKEGRLQVLASTTEAGAIFVAPGMYAGFEEMLADTGRFYQALGLTATPLEQPSTSTINGLRAMTALYQSQDQMGQIVQGRWVALLTPHGTGFSVLGMTTREQMPKLRATVDRLAGSVKAREPEVNAQLVAALAGRWMYYAGKADGTTSASGGSSHSHEEFVTFDGQGRFQWESSSSVMVTTPGMAGSAGGASANSDQGSYTVIGSTLVLRGRQGQMAFELQLMGDRFSADGRVYLRSN